MGLDELTSAVLSGAGGTAVQPQGTQRYTARWLNLCTAKTTTGASDAWALVPEFSRRTILIVAGTGSGSIRIEGSMEGTVWTPMAHAPTFTGTFASSDFSLTASTNYLRYLHPADWAIYVRLYVVSAHSGGVTATLFVDD